MTSSLRQRIRLNKSSLPLLLSLGLFLLALTPRIFDLGGFLTIDEIKWTKGAGQFLLALHSGDLAQTYWHFFPGVTTTWGEVIVLWLSWLLLGAKENMPDYVNAVVSHPEQNIFLFRLSGAVLSSFFAPGVYLIGRRLSGDWSAALAGAFIALNPFLLAHSRIVNGDAIAAGFMLLSVLAFLRFAQTKGRGMLILSAIMGGLALLTKLPAPVLAPFIGLVSFIEWFKDRQDKKKTISWLKYLLVWSGIVAITFILLFPSMWVTPINTFQMMFQDSFDVGEIGEGHLSFFQGEISTDPGWSFYLWAIGFRLTPIVILGLILLPLAFFLPGGKEHRYLISILSIYIIFIYLFGGVSPKKADRYVMAIVPALDVLAAIGYAQLFNFSMFSAKKGLKIGLGVSLTFILGVFFVIPYAPYYLNYYNPLLGGIEQAAKKVPVGWGEGLEQTANWLNAQPNAGNLLVSAWYSDIFFPYFDGQKVSFSSSGKSQLTSDYVVFYINQVQRQQPDLGLITYFQNQEPAFTVKNKGVEWAWVYPAPKMAYQAGGKTKIEGRAQLMGYTTPDKIPVGDKIPITLYLKTLGELPPNETLDVRLKLPDGNVVGDWKNITILSNVWQANALIEWQGTLSLPNNIAPGLYRLDAGLKAADSDERFARFEWQKEEDGWLLVDNLVEDGN